MKKLCSVLLLLLLTASSVNAAGLTYWVAATGGSTVGAGACTLNDGPTDPGAYMRTIQDGADCLSSGDILRIKTGAYAERLGLGDIPNGTSSNNTVVIAHDGPGTVDLIPSGGGAVVNLTENSSYIRIEGIAAFANNVTGEGSHAFSIGWPSTGHHIQLVDITATGANTNNSVGVQVQGADNQVRGSNSQLHCKLHNNGKAPNIDNVGYGAYLGGQRTLLERCQIYDNGGYAVHVFATEGGLEDIIVRYNLISANGTRGIDGTAGIIAGRGSGHQIYGNEILNDRWGITINPDCVNCRVDNNTVVNSRAGLYWIGNISGRNNIFKDNSDGNIIKDGAATGTISNTICHGNGGTGNCNINVDPRFVSLSGGNLRLCTGVNQPAPPCPGASAGLNAGINLFTSGVTSDIDGNPRPSSGPFDIGAYQRGTGVSQLVVSITTPNSTGSSSTTSSTACIAGIASSNVSITIVNWVNDRGGSGTANNTNSWDACGIPLQMGLNVITVTAVDSGANQKQVTHTIFRSGTGPVLAMGFEEVSGTTATDLSGNNNHGTFGSGVTRTIDGSVGRALVFSGQSNAFLTVPNSPSLSLGTAFTISLDAYPTQATSDFRALLIKNITVFLYGYSDPGYGCSTTTFAGFLSGAGDEYHAVCPPSGLSLNAWNRLAVTYDGATLTLYQEGEVVISQSATGLITPSSGSGSLQIGASDFGENFTGRIDHVRVYNRALSQSEIQADMAAQIGQSFGVTVKMNPLSKQVYGPGSVEVFGK